ncbi:GspH/FimT family pseudopilin [Ideonella livida]|uniref:Type II secretion system protein H n=1 Tax=Ideonella livida TaxID=2707176 RepID=A0A7C9TNL5_9BURK|nr:GspH/FimT family pseudopilin [Ideonella livida]NDY93645.1 prepilin-type N-terminal cleavage/methylation domain-containing protein [Ideonella livida]
MTPSSLPLAAARRRAAGVTLIELMVVLSVMAILMAVATPDLISTSVMQRSKSRSEELQAALRLARSEAVKRNAQVTVCASANGTDCNAEDWANGWIVLAGTTVVQHWPASRQAIGITEASGLTSLNFTGSGTAGQSATFVLCSTSTPQWAGYQISQALAGSSRLSRRTGSCEAETPSS